MTENNTAFVLDADNNEVDEHGIGELCISGKNVARGYMNKPDLTSEKFVQHPDFGRFYRTGDLVEKLPLGDFHYMGRIGFFLLGF